MLRRIVNRSRLIPVGIALKQNEQKTEPVKGVEDITSDQLPALGSVKDFINCKITRLKETFRKKNSDEGISQTNGVDGDVQPELKGWDRVKNIIIMSEHQEINPAVSFISNAVESGLTCGILLGGLREYAKAYNMFVLTNDTSKFMNANDARRQLLRVGTQGFFKGALLYGPKFAVLFGTFAFVHAAVAEYRGKNGIMEFPIAAAVTTAVMKWNLGIRGMISGFIRGGFVGLVMGPFIYMMFKLTGVTVADVTNVWHKHDKERTQYLAERKRQTSTISTDLEKFYYDKTKHLPHGFSDND